MKISKQEVLTKILDTITSCETPEQFDVCDSWLRRTLTNDYERWGMLVAVETARRVMFKNHLKGVKL